MKTEFKAIAFYSLVTPEHVKSGGRPVRNGGDARGWKGVLAVAAAVNRKLRTASEVPGVPNVGPAYSGDDARGVVLHGRGVQSSSERWLCGGTRQRTFRLPYPESRSRIDQSSTIAQNTSKVVSLCEG